MSEQRKNGTDVNSLRAWYEDSLALINPAYGAPRTELEIEVDGVLDLGILYLDAQGEETFSYGNVQSCRDFVTQHRIAPAAGHDIHMHAVDKNVFLLSTIRGATRIISLSDDFLKAMLEDLFPSSDLSSAELQILEQILCGVSLRDAAAQDGVSYETKRSQLKSLTAKTGMHTQSEVVRISLAAIMSHVLDTIGRKPDGKQSHSLDEKAFLEFYYPETFRLHDIAMGKGRSLRVADAGPISGTPVVFIHSQTLPPPSQVQNDWLEAHGIRLLIPLRRGFLQGGIEPLSSKEHLAACAEDIADTIRLFGKGAVQLVAQSTGGPYALRVIRDHPDLVEGCVLAAAAHLGRYNSGKINKFVSAIGKLAHGSNMVLEKTYEQYLKRMSTPAGFRDLLYSSYGESHRDMDIFDAMIANPITYIWMYETYRLSMWSVIRDISIGHLDVWSGVEAIKRPVTFVHGAHDPVNPPEAIRAVQTGLANSKLIELPDEGQSLFLNCFEKLVTRDGGRW